jgi:hypothetical protein
MKTTQHFPRSSTRTKKIFSGKTSVLYPIELLSYKGEKKGKNIPVTGRGGS